MYTNLLQKASQGFQTGPCLTLVLPGLEECNFQLVPCTGFDRLCIKLHPSNDTDTGSPLRSRTASVSPFNHNTLHIAEYRRRPAKGWGTELTWAVEQARSWCLSFEPLCLEHPIPRCKNLVTQDQGVRKMPSTPPPTAMLFLP